MGEPRVNGACGNGESTAERARGGRKNGRAHANDVAVHIEGGATGIALVDRSIDLNEVVVWAGADVTPPCRDDTGSNGAAQSKRVADSQNPVPDSGRLVRKLHKRKITTALDLDQGHVRARIRSYHL